MKEHKEKETILIKFDPEYRIFSTQKHIHTKTNFKMGKGPEQIFFQRGF